MLTTAQAAKVAGITPAAFRREVIRERARGRELQAPRESWPDGRTPVYDEATVRQWLESRPGPGYWRA